MKNIDATELVTERKKLFSFISDEVVEYIRTNLHQSLLSIGFSKEFVTFLTKDIRQFDFSELYDVFEKELQEVYDVGFFQKIVPEYFQKEIVPSIPDVKTLLDVGCGTGILLHKLENYNIQNLLGIDISEYPEWKSFNSTKVQFEVVSEKKFSGFLKEKAPDSVVLSWTLHHMQFDEQQRYLQTIYDGLRPGSKVIILEDGYSQDTSPIKDNNISNSFFALSIEERKQVMSVYDWFANRVLARRFNVPIPCTYRTLEEWMLLANQIGFKVTESRFIGFPEQRDINTPQTMFILEK